MEWSKLRIKGKQQVYHIGMKIFEVTSVKFCLIRKGDVMDLIIF